MEWTAPAPTQNIKAGGRLVTASTGQVRNDYRGLWQLTTAVQRGGHLSLSLAHVGWFAGLLFCDLFSTF